MAASQPGWPQGGRCTRRPLGPFVQSPFGSHPAGTLPASLPEEVMSGREAGRPAGSRKTRTRCSCEPEPRHGHWELGVAVLLSSPWDKQSCLCLASLQGWGEKNGAFPIKEVPDRAPSHSVGMYPSRRELLRAAAIWCFVVGEQPLGCPVGLAT